MSIPGLVRPAILPMRLPTGVPAVQVNSTATSGRPAATKAPQPVTASKQPAASTTAQKLWKIPAVIFGVGAVVSGAAGGLMGMGSFLALISRMGSVKESLIASLALVAIAAVASRIAVFCAGKGFAARSSSR